MSNKFNLSCTLGQCKISSLKYMYFFSFVVENGLHLPFAETLKDGATFLEKRLMTEKECASWHNTTCSILREV